MSRLASTWLWQFHQLQSIVVKTAGWRFLQMTVDHLFELTIRFVPMARNAILTAVFHSFLPNASLPTIIQTEQVR